MKMQNQAIGFIWDSHQKVQMLNAWKLISGETPLKMLTKIKVC